MVEPAQIFTFFFVTLGPLKAIGPSVTMFTALTPISVGALMVRARVVSREGRGTRSSPDMGRWSSSSVAPQRRCQRRRKSR